MLLDSMFEAVLGIVVLSLAIASRGFIMAAPAGRGVLVAAGVLLLAIAAVILVLSREPSARVVSGIALANVSSAFILAFWLIARWAQFSVSGRTVAVVTVAGLLLLAIGELLSTLGEQGE